MDGHGKPMVSKRSPSLGRSRWLLERSQRMTMLERVQDLEKNREKHRLEKYDVDEVNRVVIMRYLEQALAIMFAWSLSNMFYSIWDPRQPESAHTGPSAEDYLRPVSYTHLTLPTKRIV
eukprot:TRINITY_DN9186_c0_g1_i4.p2 TRINITY_DN9186_c0_g1~~TRINITY_DN9186_c0_g1_i4.p2  ORF type:complete len:119 (-),score=23.53 TRINITY_DN9186_c0_g1_i4:161-517(-)